MTISLSSGGILALALLLAASLAFLVFSYRRTLPPVSPLLRRILLAARALVVLLLALAVLDPALKLIRLHEEEPRVAVLLDTSLSMSLPAGTAPGGETRAAGDRRWDVARRLLWGKAAESEPAGPGPLLEEIARRFPLQLFTFDVDARQEAGSKEPAASLAPRGGGTDLARALREVRQRVGKDLAAVIVVSDGVSTGGEDPRSAAREILTPLYTVEVGENRLPPDVAVVSARSVDVAYVGSRVTVDVEVAASGFAGREAQLRLSDESGALDSTRVRIPASGARASGALHFVPASPGTHRYTVTIPPQPDEVVLANNERHLLMAIEKDKLRVLYLEPVPRWDFTFLSRTLERDEGFTFTGEIASGGRPLADLLSRLDEVDVLVLGNFPLETLDAAQAGRIAEFVEKKGKGLLLLGGEKAWRVGGGEPWKRILPVQGAARFSTEGGRFPAHLTLRGREHPVTRLADDPTTNQRIWESLPPLTAWNAGLGPRPGAEVLLELSGLAGPRAPSPRGGSSLGPLLVASPVGEGKVACLAASGFWRWSFLMWGAGKSGDHYDLLMTNLVRWLAAREDARRLRLTPDKSIFRYGEPVRFTGRLFDEKMLPRPGASVTVEMKGPGGETASLAMEELAGAPGYYRGEMRPPAPGRYAYVGRATWEGSLLGEETGTLEVTEQSIEFEDLGTNEDLLASLAEVTGGRFYRAADARSMASALDLAPRRAEVERELRAGRSPYLFLVVVALLAAEWTWRRRRGLW